MLFRSTIQQNMEEFTALGIEVAVTELDIRFTALPPTAAGLAQQKADYATFVQACNAVERCVGVTVWDFTDKVRGGRQDVLCVPASGSYGGLTRSGMNAVLVGSELVPWSGCRVSLGRGGRNCTFRDVTHPLT